MRFFRLFMGVMGCKRDQENGCVDWFRETLGTCSIPYRIFLGNGCTATHEDELVLPVDDSYAQLPWKVQAALRWALEQPENYTHFFKTDCDCQVWTDRLLVSDFDKYDYVGNFADGHEPSLRPDTFAIGAGYCFSRRAAERIVAAKVESLVEPQATPPYGMAYHEDEFVGKVLVDTYRCNDSRYIGNFQGRHYNGPLHDVIVLGNVFNNKISRVVDNEDCFKIWAAETQGLRG